MSQEKVDRYKQEKANRKTILKRERRKRIAARIVGVIVCIAIVGWIGYSVYDSAEKKAAATQTEVNVSAITDYLSGLTADDEDESTDQDTTSNENSDENSDNNEANGSDDEANGSDDEANNSDEEADGSDDEADGSDDEANGSDDEANGSDDNAE